MFVFNNLFLLIMVLLNINSRWMVQMLYTVKMTWHSVTAAMEVEYDGQLDGVGRK